MIGVKAVWRVIAVLALLGQSPVLAEPMVLTPENLSKLTLVMLQAGRPDQALRFSDALLKQDPANVATLVLKSRAERDLGRFPEALTSARAAWRVAEGDAQQYGAALAVAQALASDGQKFRAQFWLRRAVDVAPTQAAQRAAERDFDYVRSRSRLSVRLDLSLRPSSNVNNGSSEGILDYYGIPLVLSGDAQALSGIEAQMGVTARYRVAETTQGKTDLRFSVVSKTVDLSAEAHAQAPLAQASDYAFAGVEVGVDRVWRLGEGRMEATSSLSLGHNWYGGADMSNYARLDLGLNRAFSPKLQGVVRLSLEHQNRLDVPSRSADVTTLALGVTQTLANRDKLSLTLTGADTASDEADIDHHRLEAKVNWSHAKPVLGMAVSAAFSLQGRDYARSRYSPDGREDVSLSADLNLAFPKIDYMGFMPVMTIEASKTRSNISLNRSRSLGIGLTIQSKF